MFSRAKFNLNEFLKEIKYWERRLDLSQHLHVTLTDVFILYGQRKIFRNISVCLKPLVGNMNQYLQLYGASVRHMLAQNSKMYTEIYICQMLRVFATCYKIISNFTASKLNKISNSSEHIPFKLICLLYLCFVV